MVQNCCALIIDQFSKVSEMISQRRNYQKMQIQCSEYDSGIFQQEAPTIEIARNI